ncbi:hypothetical protein BGZ79_003953, partial [Entomortierella chlamydospora]
KFESVYFAADKSQALGPQTRAHAWADANGSTFFVMYESGLSPDDKKSFYEFASYKDLPTFLDVYNKLPTRYRCFFEQIRDGYSCCEYYDIDWKLASTPSKGTDLAASDEDADPSAPNEDTDTIAQLEKRVFSEFLAARNQYAPRYPVTDNQCRVLTSSTHSKISLHIIIPSYTFENNHRHLRMFLLDFFDDIKASQDQNGSGLLKYIDSGVYSRNRSIRCLGSSKRKDVSRSFIRAEWHLPSKSASDSEFYITNICPDSIRVVDSVSVNKQSSTCPAVATTSINANVT